MESFVYYSSSCNPRLDLWFFATKTRMVKPVALVLLLAIGGASAFSSGVLPLASAQLQARRAALARQQACGATTAVTALRAMSLSGGGEAKRALCVLV